MSTAAADKRKFLYRAFHPWGLDVCDRLGMPPTSDEGAIAEFKGTDMAIAASSDESGRILQRVDWFMQAIDAAMTDMAQPGTEYPVSDWRRRALREDFVGIVRAIIIEERERHG